MRFVIVLLAVSLLGLVGIAHAEDGEEPEARDDDKGAVELALLLGYGTTNSVNVLGLGGGLRAGYIFPELSFYAGALGQLQAGTTDPGEPDVEHYAHAAGLEAGYDFGGRGLIHGRPTLRGGLAYVVTPRDADDHFSSPWLGLGGTFYALIGPFQAGLDLEYRMLTRPVHNGDASFVMGGPILSLTAGVHL
jgi:hypothetical protein